MTRKRSRQRGGVYVMVLVTVAVVAAMLVGSLDVVRARSTEGDVLGDSVQAWNYAESAIGYGAHLIATEPDWRWARGDGAWVTDMPYSSGLITLEATGADGSALSTDPWQPVRLVGIGVHGRARAIVRVDLGMQGSGYTNAGSVLFANTLRGYWPLTEAGASALTDRVAGNTAEEKSAAGLFKAGATPGLGAGAAAWFSDGAELRLKHQTSYASVRTVSVWIRPDDTGTQQFIVARDGNGYDAGSWYLSVDLGSVAGAFESDVGVVQLAAPISADEWHHIALVAGASAAYLYVDGVEADSALSAQANYWSGSSSAPDVFLGYATSGGADAIAAYDPFRGSMCEFAIMSDALDAAEVQALYNSYPAPAEYKILADSWDRETR